MHSSVTNPTVKTYPVDPEAVRDGNKVRAKIENEAAQQNPNGHVPVVTQSERGMSLNERRELNNQLRQFHFHQSKHAGGKKKMSAKARAKAHKTERQNRKKGRKNGRR